MLWMWSLAMAADTMRLTVELTSDGPIVVDSVHLLQPPRPHPPGDVVVLDAEGAVLTSVELPPLAHLRTLITPDGHDVAQVPARFVTVDVPWTPTATSISLGGVSHSPIPGLLRPPPMQPAEAIWDTGPTDKRLDLVLLAEGYQAHQQAGKDCRVSGASSPATSTPGSAPPAAASWTASTRTSVPSAGSTSCGASTAPCTAPWPTR